MKKKIAFYIDTLNKGGTERATLDLINNLDYSKYDVTLIRFFPGGEYTKLVNKQIKNKVRYPIMLMFRWNKKLLHLCDRFGRKFFQIIPGKIAHKILIGDKYDIEVACGFYFPTKLISYSKKAKKISWVHMDYTIDKSIIGDFTKEQGQAFFGGMDRIVCVSEECEKKFNEKFEMKDKTMFLYNIIDGKNVVEKSKAFNPNFNSSDFNIVAVGRLTWQKGFDRLLEIHKQLIAKGIKHNLYIVGEGEEKEKLNNYIVENKLEKTAHLLGYKENPYPYIKNADLYICSSRHESFSLTVAESIVIGTPVLSTKCAGPTELLGDGKFGVLAENNVDDLTEKLEKIISDRKLYLQAKDMVKKRQDFFETKRSIGEWEKLLDNI